MKRAVILTILNMCGKAILFASVAAIIIVVLGNRNQWDTITYSNAFFLAGCLLIIGGASSKLAAGDEWTNFQRLDSESFRGMSYDERASFIVNVSSSFSLAILGVSSGILLFLISAILTQLP